VAIGVAMPDDGSANEPFTVDWLVMSANRVDVVSEHPLNA